ncbi:hypothetical protein TM1040_3444 (plasmid) [Ruegeria sp. TM1040]|nr:hypothetical protein TM1040_3444 [Ruegeria sp. TM1040]
MVTRFKCARGILVLIAIFAGMKTGDIRKRLPFGEQCRDNVEHAGGYSRPPPPLWRRRHAYTQLLLDNLRISDPHRERIRTVSDPGMTERQTGASEVVLAPDFDILARIYLQ